MIIGTPKEMDIRELEKCPSTRADLFDFYKRKSVTREHFESVVRYVEKGETVYYNKNFLAFYNQDGMLLAGEGLDWGD
ncbi:hypothetical protein ABWU89_22980 [Paenibacillus amylolyticus]